MPISWLVLSSLCFQQVFISVVYCEEADTAISVHLDADANSDVFTYCSKGWFSFGDMCYRLGGKKRSGMLTWEKAEEYCREEHNGNLVTVHSQELQDFLTAFLMQSAQYRVWIGLHDRINETDYKWEDGSPVNYTNWEPSEPSGPSNEKEDCTEMMYWSSRPLGKPGMWNDISCDRETQFICQKRNVKQGRKRLDPRYCTTEHGRGWRFKKSCFSYVSQPKTWAEAEEFCVEEYKGHLVTILDYPVTIFLNYVLQDVGEQIWIGIKTKKEYQQQWSSGWFVSYVNWHEDEEHFADEACAVRNKEGVWFTTPCSRNLPFVCEYSTAIPPQLKSSVENSYCPEKPPEWRDLGGDYCYYIDMETHVTWYKANFLCMRRGGALLSIHSKEEVDMLSHFVQYSQHVIHIGLYRQMNLDEEFVWADKSELDLAFWDSNEPNDESEQCVELKTGDMKWNDINCNQERGFICSIHKIPPNNTIEEKSQLFSCQKRGFSNGALVGVIICVLFVAVLIGAVVYYFRLCDRGYERVKKLSGIKLQPPSEFDKKPRYRTEITVNEDDDYEKTA
ncbi:secretory phospholipase A2 receptor [Caerostris darwini]|uniref:Secretory phospholipase A2 receptor n=1 Tax=Caerostris darwini TaxID=1538125 RepID=A0AAV4U4T9_9ARAC|nr:secretory phospholipase A2 receptor [Caerostris darwini]